MAKKLYEESNIYDIACALREKCGDSSKTYKTCDMASAIRNLSTSGGGGTGGGIPLPFVVSGNCIRLFSGIGWNNFINTYEIEANDVTCMVEMFDRNSTIEQIPFEINMKKDSSMASGSFASSFEGCRALKAVPKINADFPIVGMHKTFKNCYNLRYLPDEFANFNYAMEDYYHPFYATFTNCYSLRSLPTQIFENDKYYDGHCYLNALGGLRVIDELTDLPIPYAQTITTNLFYSGVTDESGFGTEWGRIKRLTFATNNGVPYQKNWSNQTIFLSDIGSGTIKEITGYNSGLTTATQVTDAASYQALKNNPDWWTTETKYSRYNHDSAVETINSLPDVSTGSNNTIKFKGESGELTDGGAINTMTSEEIAVAAAKGWTVAFV